MPMIQNHRTNCTNEAVSSGKTLPLANPGGAGGGLKGLNIMRGAQLPVPLTCISSLRSDPDQCRRVASEGHGRGINVYIGMTLS